jgi:multicomponent Na+:H+ antiporter subunit E
MTANQVAEPNRTTSPMTDRRRETTLLPDPVRRRDARRRVLKLAPVLLVFWLVLSGHYTPLLLTLMVVSVVAVCWLIWRADFDRRFDHTPFFDITLGFVLRTLAYLPWLAWQVAVSAVAAARRVWSPKADLRPTVARTAADDLPPVVQVVYANSITLTPGTLSLDVDEETIEVHSLDPEGIAELDEGGMLDRVRATERHA